MKRQCVRCGKNLSEKQKLRCGECIKLVDAELRGETNKPYQYFFKRNLKQMRKERDLFGQEGEFGCGKTRTEQGEQPIKIYGRGIHELI